MRPLAYGALPVSFLFFQKRAVLLFVSIVFQLDATAFTLLDMIREGDAFG